MNRRRSRLEMLACALLVAALAVQPAAGNGNGAPPAATNGPGNSAGKTNPAAANANANAGGKQPNPPPSANANAGGKQPNPPPSANANAGGKHGDHPPPNANAGGKHGDHPPANANAGGKHGGAKGRPAQQPGPPGHASGNPDPQSPAANAGPPAGRGPNVDERPSAPVEDRRGRPAGPAEASAAPPTHARRAPRGRGAQRNAARGATGNGAAQARSPNVAPPAGDALAIAPAPGAPAAPPEAQERDSGPLAAPGRRSSALRLGGNARGNAFGGPVRAAPQATATPSPALNGSAVEFPLVTPATEAITHVRPGGASETSRPPQADDGVPRFRGAPGPGGGEPSVVEVLASWVKYALAALGLLVLALGVNAIVAAARTRRLERQRERLMEDIGLLQQALLPAVPAQLGALLTTVAYRPADGPAAGGDFYDAFELPGGRVGLLLGDISGHGRQALAKTTLVRFTVRAHLEAGLSPREAIAIAGRSLDGRLSDDFATVIAAVHDPDKGTLTYASAGHPPPIVVGPPRHPPVTVSSAPPIGVGFPTGQRQTVLPMPDGTSVMIFSDGLLEARIDGVQIGAERLAAWLVELGPQATAKELLDRVVSQADRVPDDLAAVVLHAAPGAAAPAARIEQLKLDVLDMEGPDLDGFLRAAGASESDRRMAGRRVSELLATTSGVIVEVHVGDHPLVSVVAIGDDSPLSARPGARTR